MRTPGYLLIAAGFLPAAFASVMVGAADAVNWTLYVPALAVGAFGIVLARSQARKLSRDEVRVSANIASLEASVSRILEALDEFDRRRSETSVYDLRHEIDELFPGPIDEFVAGRESLAHRFGTAVYADIMSHFAAGERYLNRVWCCSADGYVDEARTYLERAADEFRTVAGHLEALRSSPQ